jgi:hypothetical protein
MRHLSPRRRTAIASSASFLEHRHRHGGDEVGHVVSEQVDVLACRPEGAPASARSMASRMRSCSAIVVVIRPG